MNIAVNIRQIVSHGVKSLCMPKLLVQISVEDNEAE
jgi:hypothetical protein